MNAVQPFQFDGVEVRVVTDQRGEPWFVAADVCSVLGIANPRDAVGRLDWDEKGVATTDTLGGPQSVTTISEPGLYALVGRSRKPEARTFDRWVRHEVLPAIRKTGGYQVPSGPELLARAVLEAQALLAQKDQQIEAMAPAAEAWTNLASTDGDHSLRDAAQILDRDPRISTGRNRLGAYLREIGWVDRKGIPYQRHVDLGRIRSRIRYYDNPRTGERTLADPQIRLTAKGVETLRSLMAAGSEVAR